MVSTHLPPSGRVAPVQRALKEYIKSLEYTLPFNALTAASLRIATRDPWKEYLSNAFTPDPMFIHIPKTAGTSIVRLFGFRTGHVPVTRYYAWDRTRAESAFKFAVVRNPWERLRSGYFFLRAQFERLKDQTLTPHECHRFIWIGRHIMRTDSLEEFVLKLRSCRFRKAVLAHYVFRPQLDWIALPGQNDHAMDFIGHFESLNTDLETLRTLFSITDELGSHRVTPPYKAEFTPEMIGILSDCYKHDIFRLGYSGAEPD